MPTKRKESDSEHHMPSPYETEPCEILVGEAEACFKVNEGFLQNTSFFAKHGPPKRARVDTSDSRLAPRQRSPTVACTSSDMFVPEEVSPMAKDEQDRSIDLTDTDADYVLKGQFFHCRTAFQKFVRHLQDADIGTPSDQEECEAFFKLYALAQYYDVKSLRLTVIQRLQQYYVKTIIPITDLTYIISNWPNTAETGLSRYLFAQFAYELASGKDEDSSARDDVATLFTAENVVLAQRIFEVILHYAEPDKSADPAKCRRYWREEPL